MGCGPERWLGMKHIVDKQSNQLCVSKQMVKTCLSKPVSIKKKSVEFAASHSHPSRPAPSRSVPCLASLSSRRFLSSQLFSAGKSWKQVPAALTMATLGNYACYTRLYDCS